ncbi:MAG: FMN-binding negative transcriptional regulator [Rhodospirillaceae bacterium]|jgi:predicted FMN-binding regulatory protein PaiB
MYTPKDFAEDNPDVLFDVIEANNFGLLITTDDDGATATHLPFSVDPMEGD